MRYTIILTTKRAAKVLDYMKGKASMSNEQPTEGDIMSLDIEIQSNLDALELFHSGISSGIDELSNYIYPKPESL